MEKIKCVQLWKDWQFLDPDSLLILEARNRISQYTKSDWEEMVRDANETMQELTDLIKNSIDIKAPESEKAFLKLLDHINKYFFTPTIGYGDSITDAINNNPNYRIFFDQFHSGSANKILELIEEYKHHLK